MALYGRDLLLPLTRHLDGTSGRRWSKSGPLHGQARTALFPTSADTASLTSKPDPAACENPARRSFASERGSGSRTRRSVAYRAEWELGQI